MARAFGIDISPRSTHTYDYQPDHDFVMVGVSDGQAVLDTSLLESAQQADIVLAYHYARSNVRPADQVETYLAAIEGHRVDVHVIDFEKTHNTHEDGDFALECKFMMDEIMYATGQRCILYSGMNVLQTWMLDQGVNFLDGDSYQLMYARYPWATWNQDFADEVIAGNVDPGLPDGIDSWKLWQFSADGNGQGSKHGVTSTDVDLDVFNGTLEEMKAWASVEEEPSLTLERLDAEMKELRLRVRELENDEKFLKENQSQLLDKVGNLTQRYEGLNTDLNDYIAKLQNVRESLSKHLKRVEDERLFWKVSQLWSGHEDKVTRLRERIIRAIDHVLGRD